MRYAFFIIYRGVHFSLASLQLFICRAVQALTIKTYAKTA